MKKLLRFIFFCVTYVIIFGVGVIIERMVYLYFGYQGIAILMAAAGFPFILYVLYLKLKIKPQEGE